MTRIGFSHASFPIAHTFRPLLVGRHTFATCLQLAMLFSFTGPGVPSLAVFSFFTSIWHVFHQTFCSRLGCFIVSSDEPSAHLLAGSLSVCLAPVASCDRVSVSCSKHALQSASSHCSEPLVLTPKAVFDELLLVTVLMTPQVTRHPPWHRRHGFLASLPASPPASLHASPRPYRLTSRDSVPLAEHTTALTAFACCASRVVRCVRHQLSLSPIRNRGTLHVDALRSLFTTTRRSRGLPVLQHDSPSCLFSRRSTTCCSRASEVLRADCWCSSAAVTPSARGA